MNDLQLYNLYLSIELPSIRNRVSKIYPDYVVIIEITIAPPHPSRHYSFSEFIDKLYSDPNFKSILIGNVK